MGLSGVHLAPSYCMYVYIGAHGRDSQRAHYLFKTDKLFISGGNVDRTEFSLEIYFRLFGQL